MLIFDDRFACQNRCEPAVVPAEILAQGCSSLKSYGNGFASLFWDEQVLSADGLCGNEGLPWRRFLLEAIIQIRPGRPCGRQHGSETLDNDVSA